MSTALSSDNFAGAVVSKIELARLLGTTRQTLDNWIAKYGDDFPVAERGRHGVPYRYSASDVIAFLSARKAEQDASRAERDEQLAQLMLPLTLSETSRSAAGLSFDDQIKAEKLNDMRLKRAREARELVRAADVDEALIAAHAALARNLAAFARTLGREHGWPEPIVQSVEKRLAEMQRASVREARAVLSQPEETDFAFD